jgi:hypothetical protein
VESSPHRWKIAAKGSKEALLGAVEEDGVYTLKVPSTEWEE